MVRYCCVPGCVSNTKKGNVPHFHRFPRDSTRRKEWILRLNIGREPSTHQVICSNHFEESDYFLSEFGKNKLLKPGTVPSKKIPITCTKYGEMNEPFDTVTEKLADSGKQFLRVKSEFRVATEKLMAYSESTVLLSSDISHVENQVVTTDGDVVDPAVDVVEDVVPMTLDELREVYVNPEMKTLLTEVQMREEMATDRLSEIYLDTTVGNVRPKTSDKSVTAKPEVKNVAIQTTLSRKRASFCSLTDNDLIYFTGLERQRFEILFKMLEKFNPIEDSLLWCKMDALIITLFKCRHNLDFKMMEFTFELDGKLISEIFKEVMSKLFVVLRQTDIWKLSPKHSKSYRCILDCAEFFVVRADDPNKHHPTFKLLISCDQRGVVNFISEAFVGATSDREIVIKSGFIDKLERGDAIMADKGFDISDLLESKGVLLNIPPFLKDKKQLGDSDVMKARIIENVNSRAKKNKILTTTIQKSLWPYANKIIYVCLALVNFYKPLE